MGGKILPAGNYEIRRIADEPDGLMIFSTSNNHEHAMFETEAVQTRTIPKKGVIVFHRYGDSYFLSEVFAGGEQTGRELPTTRQERMIRRETTASNKTKPETVELAAY